MAPNQKRATTSITTDVMIMSTMNRFIIPFLRCSPSILANTTRVWLMISTNEIMASGIQLMEDPEKPWAATKPLKTADITSAISLSYKNKLTYYTTIYSCLLSVLIFFFLSLLLPLLLLFFSLLLLLLLLILFTKCQLYKMD